MLNPIKSHREQLGLSRAELSRRSRSPYMTLTCLENGMNGEISEKTARRISPVLGIAADVIMDEYLRYRESLADVKGVTA